jgi:hypothetical protein
MAQEFGFSSFNQTSNPNNRNNNGQLLSAIQGLIQAVRVKSIVLNESHPRFKELGEWNSLGAIEYQLVSNPLETTVYPVAFPLTPSSKNLPLINEIVFLLALPSTNIGTSLASSTRSYYFSIVSLWNHPHHNAYPVSSNDPPPSQQKDYQQTQLGSVRRVTDNSTEIYLGNTFKERSNIHPLLPFEGDVMQEGRWGNSIRLGSTVKKRPNNWSAGDTVNGDPIIILRNGQSPNASNEGWIPITEDINTDLSSIYATSTQQIPLNVSSISYVSYKSDAPVTPNKYASNQLILNSGRLVFNSTVDHILLSSKKTVNLNAVTSVNIDAPSTIIQSNNIYLGSKDVTQPVLLGNTTVKLLNQLITNLNSFMTICSTVVSTAPGTPLGPLNMAASQMMTTLNQLQANLEGTKSKYVKTS